MVVQGAPAVLIGESLTQLPVGEYFSLEEGFEMESAKPFPVNRVGAVMNASQTGKEAAAVARGPGSGCHESSLGTSGEIMRPIRPCRQGEKQVRQSG